ncbi:hypothetical protein ACH437_31135 [Streptomyces xinghaiensis]|uniref:hypothetical protein n=1 Tax=Streptomyces xinghaiensis TaxID=1038928 RepID=UPI0037A8FA8B
MRAEFRRDPALAHVLANLAADGADHDGCGERNDLRAERRTPKRGEASDIG